MASNDLDVVHELMALRCHETHYALEGVSTRTYDSRSTRHDRRPRGHPTERRCVESRARARTRAGRKCPCDWESTLHLIDRSGREDDDKSMAFDERLSFVLDPSTVLLGQPHLLSDEVCHDDARRLRDCLARHRETVATPFHPPSKYSPPPGRREPKRSKPKAVRNILPRVRAIIAAGSSISRGTWECSRKTWWSKVAIVSKEKQRRNAPIDCRRNRPGRSWRVCHRRLN